MATANSIQILIDTNKRTVIKRVGIFDAAGGDENETVIIDPRTLKYVMNANNLPYQVGNTLSPNFANLSSWYFIVILFFMHFVCQYTTDYSITNF